MTDEEYAAFSDQQLRRLFEAVMERSYKYAGAGSFQSQFHATLSRIDRFKYRILSPNAEFSGLTFITRPRLNLTTANLRQNRTLATLDTRDNTSVPFMIRCLLDTKLCQTPEFSQLVVDSPLLDYRSPFLTPVINTLLDLSGFPDQVLESHTTEGGFYNENQSFPIGSDMNNQSFNLSANFVDVQGGIIMSLFYIWYLYMAELAKGGVVAYADDIEAQRMPFTVSIYRFLLDPRKMVITKWSKSTGCYPTSVPLGNCFNVHHGEVYVSSAAQFQIPFMCNKFEANDPAIIQDFNALMRRYYAPVAIAGRMEEAPPRPEFNFAGLPYIEATDRGLKLVFRYDPEELDDDLDETLADVTQQLQQERARMEQERSAIRLQNEQVVNDTTTQDVIYV